MAHNPAQRFLVDQLFPTNEIHLISGPARSGKTVLLMQTLDDWSNGREVFGRASFAHNRPFCYVSANRHTDAIRAQFETLGIDPTRVPHFSLLEEASPDDRSLVSTINMARERVRGLRVLFVSGMNLLCSKTTDEQVVARFLTEGLRCARKSDDTTSPITIIGATPAGKFREGEGYAAPVDRIMGSVVWNGLTATKIIIEPIDPRDPLNMGRRVFVLPRGHAGLVLYYRINDEGRMMECGPLDEDGPQQALLNLWRIEREGEVFAVKDLKAFAASLVPSISPRTVDRWKDVQLELGYIKPAKYGHYLVVPSSNPQ